MQQHLGPSHLSLTSVIWSGLFSEQPDSDILITQQKVVLLSQEKLDKTRLPWVQLLTSGTGCLMAKCLLHLFALSVRASTFHPSPLPSFTSVALGHFPLFLLPPAHSVPVDEGISTHLLSLTHPSFESKHGH